MNRIFDIIFILGLGIIFIYFLLSIFRPSYFRNQGIEKRKVFLMIPVALLLVAFLGYFVSNIILTKSRIPTKYIEIKNNLDSLDKFITSEKIDSSKVDSLLKEIVRNTQEVNSMELEQLQLQKRIFIKNFNKQVSDSIIKQIQQRLDEIKIRKNYSIEEKQMFPVVGGKPGYIVVGGKAMYIKQDEKVFNDIYKIDSFSISPILKNIDFSKSQKINHINYYIDSIKINFRVSENKGKARNADKDSLIFVSINPINNSYFKYKVFFDKQNQKIQYLDSLYFIKNSIYTLTLDFPNTQKNDTSICLDFNLKRGIIGSYCMTFK